VGFVVDKVALGQVFSEYFGFPCKSSFHQLLHNHPHLSSGADTIGQKCPQYKGLSPTPLAIKNSNSAIFAKFSKLNTNDTNTIVVIEKVKPFIGKLSLWDRKIECTSLALFSRLKNSVEENSEETSDNRINQCIKNHTLICSPGFISNFHKQ
jgi:hypothetical protein